MGPAEDFTDNAQVDIDLSKDAIDEETDVTDKIRLVILGRCGTGKSTIVSRVFGISEEEAKVSHDTPGQHNIEEELEYETNPSIVIHDSGGFESGLNNGVDIVKHFLRVRKEKELIRDQVHCIWYCVACEGGRPVEGFAKQLFSNVDVITGDTPLLIIFTKYDQLIGKHHNLLGKRHPKWSNAETIQMAEGEALKEFETRYLNEVREALKKCRRKWDWARVGNLQSADHGGAEFGDPNNETRVNDLIDKTETSLEASIRPMWIRTQRQNSRRKLEASVEEGMKIFRKMSAWSGIPLIPLKELVVDMVVARSIFADIQIIWNQDDGLYTSGSSVRSRMQDAIRAKSLAHKVASRVLDVFDITGFLTQAGNAVNFMNTVAGIALIHDQLFWRQKMLYVEKVPFSVKKRAGISGAATSRVNPLNEDQVIEVIKSFQNSDKRERMCAHIEGRLYKYGVNWKKAYSKGELQKIIQRAIEIAQQGGNI